jgi:hypothetical protein
VLGHVCLGERHPITFGTLVLYFYMYNLYMHHQRSLTYYRVVALVTYVVFDLFIDATLCQIVNRPNVADQFAPF